MTTGSWNVKVSMGSMPEKVATAVAALSGSLVGAEYEPIAYLGSRAVNGINHAVLAKQIILTGRDTTNIVVLIFNERGNDCTLVSIERVLESGSGFGSAEISVSELTAETKAIWDNAFAGYVGMKVAPFIFLGTQMTKGASYIFAAEVEPMILHGENEVDIVTINPMDKTVSFANMLISKQAASLGYTFSW